MEELKFNDMFGDIYRIETGESYEEYADNIPAEFYEKLFTKYFDITSEQLKQYSNYDPVSKTYPWDIKYGRLFEPKPEVVDYTYNKDGTLTLIVDALWIDYRTDCAFTSTLKISPNKDGSFKYISNKVEAKEKKVSNFN